MARRYTFEEVLQALGHVYIDAQDADGPRASEQVRHIIKVYQPTGDILPICGKTLVQGDVQIGCPALFRDVNCSECLSLAGIDGESLTKRSLLVDCVHAMMDIEQMFLDVMYWNYHNPDEEPINPDPDGQLAEAWEQSASQIAQMIDRFRPTMTKHAGVFGWPEIVDQSDNDRA